MSKNSQDTKPTSLRFDPRKHVEKIITVLLDMSTKTIKKNFISIKLIHLEAKNSAQHELT